MASDGSFLIEPRISVNPVDVRRDPDIASMYRSDHVSCDLVGADCCNWRSVWTAERRVTIALRLCASSCMIEPWRLSSSSSMLRTIS